MKKENERRLDVVCDEKEARKKKPSTLGPRVPEGPVVDELIINAEPDLKDRLKNVSKAKKAYAQLIESKRTPSFITFQKNDMVLYKITS
ncbi:unnamed protein product [Strongylus vulgaris]|uniref:Uncharacterized protein n=1 Tax=Strongylus vulgaris TaxID=40348 RepID=A0A3P7LIE9_STRVU|nr:unnamed protein product [Strongylus vulgaris]